MAFLLCSFVYGCKTEVSDKNEIDKTTAPPTSTTSPVSQQPDNHGLTSSKYPAVGDYAYMTTKNGEIVYDNIKSSIPGFIDVVSFSKYIDDDDIYFYLEVRDLPDLLVINQPGLSTYAIEYIWRISFDTNLDGKIYYDTSLNHQKFRGEQDGQMDVPVDDSSIFTIALQQKVRSDYKIADCEFEINGKTLVYHIKKGDHEELHLIHENTPFYILTENNTNQNYFNDLITSKSDD